MSIRAPRSEQRERERGGSVATVFRPPRSDMCIV